jgi:hypothetical protein
MASREAKSFDQFPVIGALPPRQIAARLRRMGDPETADQFLAEAQKGAMDGLFGMGPPPAWKHTAHQYGFIPLLTSASLEPVQVVHAGAVQADESMKNQPININLDRLRVFQYPGGGHHKVMFVFKAQNQIANAAEQVTFSQVYDIVEGETAGVAGQPVFLGLNVGTVGVGFEIDTVNVSNTGDKAILDVLESDPFKSGLNLLSTAQPVIKPFTDITLGVAKMLLTRNNNVKVQHVSLGLDFTPAPFGVRLAQGEYLVVQVPSEDTINWDDWVFNPKSGTVVDKASQKALPYNYFVFRVSR